MAAGIGSFLAATTYSSNLAYIDVFRNFSQIFEQVNYPLIKYNAQLVATILLITLFEVGLGSGFGTAATITARQEKRKAAKTADVQKTPAQPAAHTNGGYKIGSTVESTAIFALHDEPARSKRVVDDQGLRRDEQSVMELFLYGKVSQIAPLVNVAKPEGYQYEGVPQLDWDTKRSRQVLDSLVRKGYLNADLADKVIVCRACGSANVRVRTACPECGSLRLHKESLLEHFSCGAVERQTLFETENGDLVCPKCKGKLQLIGSDYRILPPAYLCQSCNTLNSEPLFTIKCGACGSTALVDEEPEIYLYKYTANPEMPMQELQQIKPLDVCTKFFKSLGYMIVAPAFVSGRSGTQHLFDILILGRVGWVETQKPGTQKSPVRGDNGNTAVEVLISAKPIEVEEITRIYGKINDIDCDFILFVIPGLTAEARNYATAYNLKVCEGTNIEQALASSKIPKANEGKA